MKNYRQFFIKKDDSYAIYANDLLDRFLFSDRFFKALWIEVFLKGLKIKMKHLWFRIHVNM